MLRRHGVPDILFCQPVTILRPLIPILYCTRTLQRGPTGRLINKSQQNQNDIRRLHITRRLKEPEPDEQEDERPAIQRLAIERFGSTQTESENANRSTITRREEKILDRMFKQLNKDPDGKSNEGENDVSQWPAPEMEDESLSHLQQMHKVLDVPLINNRAPSPKEAQEGVLLDETSDMNEERGLNFEHGDLIEHREPEMDARTKKLCQEHAQRIFGLIEGAETDVGLWQILEDEVFSLITRQANLEDETLKNATPKSRRGKNQNAQISPNTTTAQETHSTPTSTTSDDTPSTNLQSLSLPTINAILRSQYHTYCLHALQTYRKNFPFTPYALHVLSRIKSLGSHSTSLGLNSNLYNEIIYQSWTLYRDAGLIATLLEEMDSQGILRRSPNDTTMDIVLSIIRQHEKALRGGEGPVLSVWSRSTPAREKWDRLKNTYLKVVGDGQFGLA